jgi:hypothetical protein
LAQMARRVSSATAFQLGVIKTQSVPRAMGTGGILPSSQSSVTAWSNHARAILA